MSEAGLRPISKKSLREEAYLRLREAIIKGSLAPGQQLGEPQLASEFQTSRSPIREALGRLEQEGFVTRKPNGRLYVAPLDEDELRHLYEIRANLEGLAAELAIPCLTAKDLERLELQLHCMQKHAAKKDIDLSLEYGEAFHGLILEASGNPPLIEIVVGLRLRIRRFRRVIGSTRSSDVRIAEHQAILDALRNFDGPAARKAMENHIRGSAAIAMRGDEQATS